jgi:hypothetical protein
VGGGAKSALKVTALSKGAWANNVIVDVDYDGIPSTDTKAFNLTVTDLATKQTETFSRVTMDSALSNYVVAVVNDGDNGSQMVSVSVPDATAGRPAQTGTVGGDITMSAIKNDKNYTLKISADIPTGKIANVNVPFIDTGEPIPGSILGVCRLLERKTNLALAQVLPGAAVKCVPSSSGAGIRVLADFSPDLLASSLDTQITIAVGAPDDAAAILKLNTATSNVAHYKVGNGRTILGQSGATAGVDGTVLPKTADLIGSQAAFTGIFALEKVDLFNILCIPDATRALRGDPTKLDASNIDPNSIFSAAIQFCKRRRAFLIVDPPPNIRDMDSAVDWKSSGLTVNDTNGAAYFPRIRAADPLNDFQLRTFAPCGVVAGLYSRIDSSRGVWKAPAGIEASLNGVNGLVYSLSDAENGALNPLGLNCFRTFPIFGTVSWGARTLVGSDAAASEWKYVPVRRLALFIEETLFRGTKWVVFEPNDEPLWAAIRLNITAFMHNLFRQGAFQGTTPREAYLVKCDKETTTQDDINRGVVNILVGFAPLKPAEFVIIKIQQLAGQNQA